MQAAAHALDWSIHSLNMKIKQLFTAFHTFSIETIELFLAPVINIIIRPVIK